MILGAWVLSVRRRGILFSVAPLFPLPFDALCICPIYFVELLY